MTRIPGMIPAEAARYRDTRRRRFLLRCAAGAATVTLLAALTLPAVAQEPAYQVTAYPSAAPSMVQTHPDHLSRIDCLLFAAAITGSPVMIEWRGVTVYTFWVARCVPAGEPT